MVFRLELHITDQCLPLKLEFSDQSIPIEFEGVQTVTEFVGEAYTGEVEITPSPEEQVLHTTGKLLAEDVVIKPIPNNYGLVTYDNRKIITIT